MLGQNFERLYLEIYEKVGLAWHIEQHTKEKFAKV